MAKCTLKKEGQDWQKLNVKDAWEKPPPCAASQKMARGGWWVQNDMAEQWWRWWWWIVCLRESADPKTSEGPFGSWLTCDSSIFCGKLSSRPGGVRMPFHSPALRLTFDPQLHMFPSRLEQKKKKIDKGSWGSCWGLFWLVWLTSGAWISTKVLH